MENTIRLFNELLELTRTFEKKEALYQASGNDWGVECTAAAIAYEKMWNKERELAEYIFPDHKGFKSWYEAMCWISEKVQKRLQKELEVL